MSKIGFLTLMVASIISYLLLSTSSVDNVESNFKKNVIYTQSKKDNPPSIEMFLCIEKYSKEYDIPKNFAYGIAFSETRYKGPLHWEYNPSLTSSAGAVGPMQIMPSTSNLINKEKYSIDELRTNIDLNVKTSMKLLRRLYNKYGDWKLVFGAYNTGKPCINSYSEKVFNYKPDW
jgi:soluble lytic murein transglycosylase-like protein